MKKTIITTTLILASAVTFAQKDRSKGVETQYLSLPTYNLSEIDPSTIKVEFAMKDGVFGTEKMKETKSKCVPKGGSIKDVIEVPAYHFEIPYTQQESYVVAKTADGKIVYANKASEQNQSSIRFGWDDKMKQSKCEYWISDALKKDFKAQGAGFKVSEHVKHMNSVYDRAISEVQSNVYLSYFPEKFDVYSGKGKTYDYAELDKAFEIAMEAYSSIKSNGVNKGAADQLKSAIEIWEMELGKEDLEDKKARISKDISRGLRENCVRAYMHLYKFDKASEHARAFMETYGNFSNNRSQAMEGLMKTMEFQRIAAEKNSDMLTDLQALNSMAQGSSKSVGVSKLKADQFDRLKSDYDTYRASQFMEVADSRKKQEEELIASGQMNPYEKYVQDTGITGKAIMFTMAPSALSGFPELTEVPAEMCELKEISQLIIRMNKIESVSPEIKNLTNLTKLDLTGNNLKTLPPEIGQLGELKTLNLGKNPLTSLPDEIANLSNLKTINLKETNLSKEEQEKVQRLLPDAKIKF